jgi:hypothetical protein
MESATNTKRSSVMYALAMRSEGYAHRRESGCFHAKALADHLEPRSVPAALVGLV